MSRSREQVTIGRTTGGKEIVLTRRTIALREDAGLDMARIWSAVSSGLVPSAGQARRCRNERIASWEGTTRKESAL